MNALQTTLSGAFFSLFARSPKATPPTGRAMYLTGYGEGYDAGYEAGLRVAALAEKSTLTALLRVIERQPESAADNVKQLLAFPSAA